MMCLVYNHLAVTSIFKDLNPALTIFPIITEVLDLTIKFDFDHGASTLPFFMFVIFDPGMGE